MNESPLLFIYVILSHYIYEPELITMFFIFLASPVVIRSGLYTMQMNYILNETGESFLDFRSWLLTCSCTSLSVRPSITVILAPCLHIWKKSIQCNFQVARQPAIKMMMKSTQTRSRTAWKGKVNLVIRPHTHSNKILWRSTTSQFWLELSKC